MDKFERAGGMQRGSNVARKNARRLQAQDRPDALASGKHTVTHGRVDGRRLRSLSREQSVESSIHGEPVFLEKGRQFHRRREATWPSSVRIVTIQPPAPD